MKCTFDDCSCEGEFAPDIVFAGLVVDAADEDTLLNEPCDSVLGIDRSAARRVDIFRMRARSANMRLRRIVS